MVVESAAQKLDVIEVFKERTINVLDMAVESAVQNLAVILLYTVQP